MATIGFIGLGRMGFPMARNLVRAGHEVRAFDINPRVHALAEEVGIAVSADIHDVVGSAEFVLSMVPTGRQVLDIFAGDGGALSRMRPGSMAIDSSTIDVAEARQLHAAGDAHGIAVLDAPVSGGVMGAEGGTLTFMVGGRAQDLERARPVLAGMGRNILHAGAAGVGQAAKVCNNLLAGISMIAVSEAFALARQLGLDPAKMREITSMSSGSCYSLTHYPPVPDILPNVPSSRAYKNGFASALMLKDLLLAQQAALRTRTALPMGGLAAALYGFFCQAGNDELDYSGIIRMIDRDMPEARQTEDVMAARRDT